MSYDLESKKDGPFILGGISETVLLLALILQVRTGRCRRMARLCGDTLNHGCKKIVAQVFGPKNGVRFAASLYSVGAEANILCFHRGSFRGREGRLIQKKS